MKNAAPWMVALIAFAALFPAVRRIAPPSAPEKPAAPAVAVVEAKKKNDVAAEKAPGEVAVAVADPCHPGAASAKELPDHPAWCEPLRTFREALGLEPSPHLPREENLREIAGAIRGTDLRLRFMVALVPDPVESGQPVGFDNTLDSLQKGFAHEQFGLNRFWLPWKDEAGKRNLWYREEPGILLFQKTEKGKTKELAVVFLVGETPKAGMQRQAFREALRVAWRLGGDRAEWKVAVLGPSFSGSAPSLRTELDAWRAAGPVGPFAFQIATGSATADSLETQLGGYDFCRTAVSAGTLQQQTFDFLKKEMNWRLRHAALLAEGDTAYGQSLKERDGDVKDVLLIRFPSHIADVRTAWQRDAAGNPDETKVKVGDTLVPLGKPALKLSAEAQGEPVDVVPSFSSLTTPAKDLELSNVLETISREGIRYVGILATDINDKLFLAGQIHRSSPDTLLFTFESNLLFAHPEYGSVMDGTLVASSAPLFTEGAHWLPRSAFPDEGRWRRQFESEAQEGNLAAVRFLLGDTLPPPRPQVWISVVGNGSLWPLRVLPVAEDAASYCGVPKVGKGAPLSIGRARDEPVWNYESWLSGRTNLQVLALAGWLCLLSYLMERTGLLKGCPGGGGILTCTPVDRPLILCGAALITVSAGVVLVVGSIPEWATYFWREKESDPYWDLTHALYIGSLVLIYGYLVRKFFALLPLGKRIRIVLFIPSLVVLPLLLIRLLVILWMPGGEIAFFQLRALTLGSGLSPLVSLGLLITALWVWIFCDIARQRLVTEMKTAWPGEALRDEALTGCDKVVASIEAWQERTFPRSRRLWILLASLFLPPDLLLWSSIQPVAETKAYGRIFLLFFIAAGILALISFARFFVLWRRLLWLLRRLKYLSPVWLETFRKLAPEVEWQATRTFAFRLPRVKMLALATDKLGALRDGWDARDVVPALRRYYQSEAEGLTLDEKRNRHELERLLEEAGGRLDHVEDPQVREFFAVRMVAHLRYHFAHLRNSLMAAMVMSILILVAVTSYFFEPKQFVSLTIWGTLTVGVALTFWSFLQMDRDMILSLIGKTEPGQVSFDKAFFANLALYVLVPALSVVATQFPEVGRLLGRVSDEFLRVAGGG
jgi:hypothetical protein